MWLLLSASLAFGQPKAVDYLREVRPILAQKCFACHGALQQKASLRLDTAAFIKEGGGRGPAIVPGKSGESLLLDHVLERNGKRRMPPPSDGEPLSPAQVDILTRWIDRGAPSPPDEKPEADPRDHWAFRPIQRPGIPAGAGEMRNPIDALLAAAWAKNALTPQPTADRRLILRRLYVDLVGVPPSLAEQDAFLADDSDDAVEKVVDRLLQSPLHGQRWARHWMDIWRYSDHWGLGAEVRNSQKHIWHWRDWIVDSLNRDRGYDQMLREMLAADELYPTDLDRLRAGGYLARQYFKFNRSTWLDDVIEHTSKAFLGLTVNCAKCHDHKYDPISQADYYRLRAFFEPYQIRTLQAPGETDFEKDGIPHGYDAHSETPTYLFTRGDDRQPVKERPLAPGVPVLLSWKKLAIEPVTLPREAQSPGLLPHVLDNHLRAAQQQIVAAGAAVEKAKADLAEKDDEARRASLVAAEKKLLVTQALTSVVKARHAAERSRIGKDADAVDLAKRAAAAEKTLAVLQAEETLARADAELLTAAKRPEAEKKRAAAVDALAKAKKLAESPGEAFTPLAGARKTPESNLDSSFAQIVHYPATSTGRRTALANWLTDPRHPLTARVAVNHIWSRHFGKPLVATVFDLGRKGAAPSHAELLDFLAAELIEHDWSMKHIHRLIATSHYYRLSSSSLNAETKTLAADPENRLLWRREPIRLESQAIRDSLLHLAGELDVRSGGPPVPIADELMRRRAMYFVHSHNDNQKFLALFDDASVRECYRRSESIVPQQALALANSKIALTMAAAINMRLHERGPMSDDDFIRAAFEMILASSPDAEEMTACREALAEWRGLREGDMRARGHLVHALLNHNDFVTVR